MMKTSLVAVAPPTYELYPDGPVLYDIDCSKGLANSGARAPAPPGALPSAPRPLTPMPPAPTAMVRPPQPTVWDGINMETLRHNVEETDQEPVKWLRGELYPPRFHYGMAQRGMSEARWEEFTTHITNLWNMRDFTAGEFFCFPCVVAPRQKAADRMVRAYVAGFDAEWHVHGIHVEVDDDVMIRVKYKEKPAHPANRLS